ncbi:MAG: hypothetical protein JO157_14220 [Acetobacteraceae bacterium]|nr:hypothetical protein [Acetobacteraceae bacterium]
MRPRRTAAQRCLGWAVGRWPLFLGLALVGGFYAILPPAKTLFVISARSETVRMQVSSEEAAVLGFRNASFHRPGAEPTCLSDVRISPHKGAIVQYARYARGSATITIDVDPAKENATDEVVADVAPLRTSADNGPPPGWAEWGRAPVILVLDPKAKTKEKDCGSGDTLRLPVFGFLRSLGEEAGFNQDPLNPRLTLLSGTVQPLVRATEWNEAKGLLHWLDWPVGMALRTIGLAEPGELFAMGQTVLPPGSVVRGDMTEGADWRGFADLDFADTIHRGFQVEASSLADSLDVLLPASLAHHGEAEEKESLSLTLVERAENDPGLRLIAIFIAALIAFGEIYERFLHREGAKTGARHGEGE